MPSIFDTMSASERSKIADQITAAAESMSADERRELISTLSAALEKDVKAKAETDKTKSQRKLGGRSICPCSLVRNARSNRMYRPPKSPRTTPESAPR
jgi:hypothetical protein